MVVRGMNQMLLYTTSLPWSWRNSGPPESWLPDRPASVVIDPEAVLEFRHPLLHQMRWAEHRKGFNLSAVHEFAENQARLDGFSDAHIVGNQQAGEGKAKRHQEGNQLVRAGLKGQLGRGTERASPPAQGQA